MFDCDPAAVIDQQLAAWRARDAEAFASHYAADAVMTDHPGVVTFSGREAIQARYARAFAARGPAQVVIETRIVSGDYVIDDETVSWAQGGGRGVVIYRVQNCLITRADYLPFQTAPAAPEPAQ
ncbi:SgcJ/EcaC family oxidoreductase [Brevundimonas sp.]|uniref:nuclear transport factor 2 family protein n=1 Tax=Brevundimonas sp. TaxID=1871086 RepID=UPI00272FB12A|nr:SgcJ/EcaC family oxidoreductase [Brevundimonas sp.]MDP1913836.1 SgcJ/EcaC family oxidoreductase [Brevundimonas sp.]